MLADPRTLRPATLVPRALALGLDVALAGSFAGLGIILGSRLGIGQFLALAARLGKNDAGLGDADLARIGAGVYLAGAVLLATPLVFAWRTARAAATPGKAMLALTVRDFATGGTPSFGKALARELLRLAHVPFFLIPSPIMTLLGMGLCVGLAYDVSRNRASRTWYDRATDTIVLVPAALVDGGGDEERT